MQKTEKLPFVLMIVGVLMMLGVSLFLPSAAGVGQPPRLEMTATLIFSIGLLMEGIFTKGMTATVIAWSMVLFCYALWFLYANPYGSWAHMNAAERLSRSISILTATFATLRIVVLMWTWKRKAKQVGANL